MHFSTRCPARSARSARSAPWFSWFLGAWENERRNRRAEARKEAAEDRAALEAQANEFVAAVLSVKLAGNTHDHLYGGRRAKAVLVMRLLIAGTAAYARSPGNLAFAEANHAVSTVINQWDRESTAAAAELTAPLSRAAAAVTPLMRRQEPGLAAAVEDVFTAVGENYADDDRITGALRAFHEALRPALEPPSLTPRCCPGQAARQFHPYMGAPAYPGRPHPRPVTTAVHHFGQAVPWSKAPATSAARP
ncbi:hypothetical protein [Streptomyces geranii]|uniref:hypothetical protein n=1 Tax=Streptomyces geranii TaxID=2058923 RepID=UPI0013009E97|nr:hypothetical protein [Streptomyces geranii]